MNFPNPYLLIEICHEENLKSTIVKKETIRTE